MKMDINHQYSLSISNREAHVCDISDEDYEVISPKLEMIKRIAEIESSIYAVFDLHKQNYLLQSKEQLKIFGFAESLVQAIDLETHYERIHPDDLAFVLETDNLLYEFFSEMSFEERRNYKLVYDFRTRNSDDIYMRYMHQSIPLEQDKNGRTWLNLVISHCIMGCTVNVKSQRRLINMKTGKLHLFNELDGEDAGFTLTKREREVLVLISQGYDSYNIAHKMEISINTVNNHRQHILQKTRTENATQAVLYCRRIGVV